MLHTFSDRSVLHPTELNILPPSLTRVDVKGSRVYLRWTLHLVIVTIRDNKDYIRVLLYSYYTTITGWGVLLRCTPKRFPESSDGIGPLRMRVPQQDTSQEPLKIPIQNKCHREAPMMEVAGST